MIISNFSKPVSRPGKSKNGQRMYIEPVPGRIQDGIQRVFQVSYLKERISGRFVGLITIKPRRGCYRLTSFEYYCYLLWAHYLTSKLKFKTGSQ